MRFRNWFLMEQLYTITELTDIHKHVVTVIRFTLINVVEYSSEINNLA